VKEVFFKGVDPGKGWKIERNPGGPTPARAAAPAGARRPASQAAQRTRGDDAPAPR
jgi:hypothetical protein